MSGADAERDLDADREDLARAAGLTDLRRTAVLRYRVEQARLLLAARALLQLFCDKG
jgi:hypothetical protein